MRRTLQGYLILLIIVCASWPHAGHAYVWGGYRWASRQVPYYINPANADVTQSAAITAIQAGAATWTQQSNADFAFYYMGQTSGSSFVNNGKNEVFFRNTTTTGGLVAETMRWFDGAGNLLDTDIAFYDGSWQFFTGSTGCSGGVFLEDFAAHEFGHALGLKHSTVTTATMYPTGSNCSTSWRILDADDLTGVEAIYPPTTANSAPTVTITAPGSGISVAVGSALTFTGSASDKEDGNLSSRLTWTSNLDGQIGTGSAFTRTLTVGTHTISAQVLDSAGASGSRQVFATVTPTSNSLPAVSISSPANSATVVQGSAFNFSGSATDREDGALSGRLTWTSNIDGQLGVGSSFSRVLSVGTHTITAAVTDSAGGTGSGRVSVAVTAYVNQPPTVSISAPSNNSSVADSTSITFAGSGIDTEDGNLTARLTWRSNLDGPLGIGSGFNRTLSAGTHLITAEVTDSAGAVASRGVTIGVTGSTVPPPSGLLLNVTGQKARGVIRADVLWSGAGSAMVNVYRNGSLVMTTGNDGSETDVIGKKGGGSYTYKVCEVGTAVCSNTVTIRF